VPAKAEISVVIAAWPNYPKAWHQPAIEARIARMQELVRAIRDVRNRYLLDVKKMLDIKVRCSDAIASDLKSLKPFLAHLGGVGELECGPQVTRPSQSASHVHPDFEAYISLAGLIDVNAEIVRLEKMMAEKQKQIQAIESKLSNESFVQRAPVEVVAQQRETQADLVSQVKLLAENMVSLKQGN